MSSFRLFNYRHRGTKSALNIYFHRTDCFVERSYFITISHHDIYRQCLHGTKNCFFCRNYARCSEVQYEKLNANRSLAEATKNPYAHLTVAEKLKEAGKDATYGVVIISGITALGIVFYFLGSELFSSQSTSGLYSDALNKCKKNTEVAAVLGEPIKGYGETSRRGRRRHVSHVKFDVDGVQHTRLRFYIEGPHRKAIVLTELKQVFDVYKDD